MSIIVVCPKCRKAVGVSEAADPQSWMRCPLCGDRYQLQTALAVQPPMLEPIALPQDQQLKGTAELNPPSEVKIAATEFPSLPPNFVREPGIASLPESVAPQRPADPLVQQGESATADHSHLADHFASIPVSTAVEERVARAQKNPLIELLKIVLGGIAGLILGYAVLLWGFHTDPFKLVKHLPPELCRRKRANKLPKV